ncbi:hypothetical protein DFJ74DRAFT_707268 [Hyaloraphidium curvatum]|nr:hypothetical protein DFJ74DRAFT_707268 [Hyaloraphidium curvatum]
MAEPVRMSLLSGDDADAPADRDNFLPREWLALVPAELPPIHPLSESDTDGAKRWAAEDPAAALRAAEPITRAAMLDAFSGSPPASASAYVAITFELPLPFHLPIVVANIVTVIAIAASAFRTSEGAFGTAQLAAGVAAIATYMLSYLGYYLLLFVRLPRNAATAHSPDALGIAPLVRWSQLVRSEPRGPLVRHKDGDALCPCERPSCAGGAPSSTASHAWLGIGLQVTFMYTTLVLLLATPLITLGGRLLDLWWGWLLTLVFALLDVTYFFVAIGQFTYPNIALADLEAKLQHRAASVALARMLDRYRAILLAGPETPRPERPEQDLYIRLHYRLSALWRSRNSHGVQVFRSVYTATIVPALFLGMVTTMATGGCLSAWQLAALAQAVHYEVNSLLGLAALNGVLDVAADVYRSARREADVLIADALRRGDSPSWALEELRQHGRVLSSFLELDGLRALFFGFPISYGLLRTFVATSVTLGIGAWTVLRTLGVFVTFESVCPTR